MSMDREKIKKEVVKGLIEHRESLGLSIDGVDEEQLNRKMHDMAIDLTITATVSEMIEVVEKMTLGCPCCGKELDLTKKLKSAMKLKERTQ